MKPAHHLSVVLRPDRPRSTFLLELCALYAQGK